MSERVTLLPVDAADVTILDDNSLDISCTGWKVTHELARQLPGAYVQTSVGTRLHFG